MDELDKQIIPTFAQAFFCGSLNGVIKQVLQFDYYDFGGYYKKLESNQKEFDKECLKLLTNMQDFLDEEINRINNQRVYPKVKFIDIEFRGGLETMPFITWIIEFNGIFKKGINTYEATTPEEELAYNCRSLWSFPEEISVLKVSTKMSYEIQKNHVVFWAEKEQIIGGEETILFKLKG